MKEIPAIVVIAHNRVNSLGRLLDSLKQGLYPDGCDVPLVISIDAGTEEVKALAKSFEWKMGSLRVIEHNEALGIKNHVLKCGDLVDDYDSIIMLEDDLLVSPYFYDFTLKCLERYESDERIAGGSLFHHQLNETAKRVFRPLQDGNDVYFMQLAASWGQFWNKKQWKKFRAWAKLYTFDEIQEMAIPWDVRKWPKSSWKKWFTAYLVDSGNYVVYPRFSQATNFMEPGENNPVSDFDYQTELDQTPRNWRFVDIDASKARFDAYCELDAGIVRSLNAKLENYDFEVDLNGTKPLSDINRAFLLTVRRGSCGELGFQRTLSPEISNIIFDLEGHEIVLMRKENVEIRSVSQTNLRDEIKYSFKVPSHLLDQAIREYLESRTLVDGINFLIWLYSKKIKFFFNSLGNATRSKLTGHR